MSVLRNAGFKAGVFFLFFILNSQLSALSPQELNRVLFLNETGFRLERLFSRNQEKAWGPDLLGRKGLDYGSMRGLFLHYTAEAPLLDYLAIDSRGVCYYLPKRQILEGDYNIVEISVRNRNTSMKAPVLTSVYISNATSTLFNYLFVAPFDSSDWGFDVLNDSSLLEPGASRLVYVPDTSKYTQWEILVLSKAQSWVQRRLTFDPTKSELFLDISSIDIR